MEVMSDKIQNPLKDENTLLKVFESYSKSTKGRSFYNELLHTIRGVDINDEESFNKFYVFMFKNWRNRILHYGQVKFVDMFPHNNYPRLIEYLKFIPEPKTKEEVDTIMKGKFISDNGNPYKDKDIFDLKVSRWDSDSRGKWYSCASGDVFDYRNKYMKKEHILFVNVNQEQIYNFASIFVSMCDEERLPYDFKLNLVGQRDDGFQIYTDSEHLIDFINIVEEIKEKYPYFINTNKEIPLLTGKISDGLSYGTYNPKKEDIYEDFFTLRCSVIAKAINSTTVDYIRKNKNRKLDYHNMQMPLYEYLALKAKDNYIEKLKKDYIEISTMKSESEAIKEIGYSFDELSSITFSANTYSNMMMSLDDNLDSIRMSNGEFKSDDVKSPVFLLDVLKELSPYLYKMDKEYKEDFDYLIRYESTKCSIDRFNFSISSNASELDTMIYKSKEEIGIYR